MKQSRLWTFVVAFGWLSVMGLPLVCQAAEGPADTAPALLPPTVFQAAGPTSAAIQGTIDAYRAALGEPNNANNPGPLATGRREINWDGGGTVDVTTDPVTPFTGFLDSRGGLFLTPGTGLSQAPPAGGPQGGLAGLFSNPTYGTIFSPFSPLRLFTPVGSNITDAWFFVPGSNGGAPATVKGFGAVFTDVDAQEGSTPYGTSTRLQYWDAHGQLLFSGVVPASPGDGTLSFFGIVFDDARIAAVRITTGTVAPGPDDDATNDIVIMDDFFYGEPQPFVPQ